MSAVNGFQSASRTACVALLAGACSEAMSLGDEGLSLSGGSPSVTLGGSTTMAGGTATGGASAGGQSATSNEGGSVSGGVTSVGGSDATTGGIDARGGMSSTTSEARSAGGVAAATGGVAPATGGIAPATGGVAPATGGVAPATGGVAPATGGTATSATSTATLGTGGAIGIVALCAPPTVTLTGANAVVGTMITFNDNGGWSWYQDERAVVDVAANKLLIGSVASGGSRDSDQEAVVYDIATGTSKRFTLETDLNPDDHNAPGFTILPDGTYAAIWATHRDTCYSYYSVFDGFSWFSHKTFDWTADGCPWDAASNPSPAHMVTYANPWYLSAENKILSPTRSVSTNPAMLSSTDGGNNWKFYGLLISSPVGYVAGYYKYWGNGVDRVDFVGTEAHPRDDNNNLWHGYYKGGKLYNSTDVVIDDNAGDTNAQDLGKFTKVFATGTSVNGKALCRMWNHDITRYADGTIAILGQGRADNCSYSPSGSDPDKRMVYIRWDGSSWKTTYLVHAGPKLYADEEDYTGLGALDPNDPTTIYVSTPYDPRKDTMVFGAKREIWRGTTCDSGATFKWTPVTANSTKDNIRPVVPKWDENHTALLWMRGTYTTAQSYSEALVGTISSK